MSNVTDGRRNNGGRSNPGAGRPTKKTEENIKKAILRAEKRNKKSLDRIWDKIFKMAEEGSVPHARLLLEYKYGKAVETVKLEQKSMSLHVVQTIVEINENSRSGDKPAIQQKAEGTILS